MAEINFEDSLVVGIDVHKYSHTAVLINPYSKILAEYKLDNSQTQFKEFVTKVSEVAGTKSVIYALEDTHGYGGRLSNYLCESNYIVYSVPASLVGKRRGLSPHVDKTDSKDALQVAKLMVTEHEKLTQMEISEQSKFSEKLKALIDDREHLVKTRTGFKNQLHMLLHSYFGDKYKSETPYKGIFGKKAINKFIEKFEKVDGFREQRILGKLRLIKLLKEQIEAIDKEIKITLEINESARNIQTIPSCGNIVACSLLAEIGDINRFQSSSALAKYAGIAPRSHSSGMKERHYTDRRGNRILNKAFHSLALTQISRYGSLEAKRYFARKIKEGKTKLQALKCLKRRFVNIVYQVLKENRQYYPPKAIGV